MSELIRKITAEYYVLNAKVLPTKSDENENTLRYKNLIENWFNNGYKIVVKGDKKHYYSLRKLDKIDEGKIYYGVIAKFYSFETMDFIDRETNRLIPQPIPENVEGRVNEYEFVFVPESHRFAVIKVGKIDTDVKRTGAPLNKIKEIVKIAFDNGLNFAENTIVETVTEDFIFEEILSSNLLSLKFRISYTNDDVLPEGRELMDSLLKDDNIGEFFGRLKPDNSGIINTENNGMTKGILELARENGDVKAVIENENGRKTVNSVEAPALKSVESEQGGNRFLNFMMGIYNELTRNRNNEE